MASPKLVDLKPEPNPNLIKELSFLLERAKAGDVVSGAFCGSCADGSVVTFISKSRNKMLELAAVTRLLHRMNCLADDDMRNACR